MIVSSSISGSAERSPRSKFSKPLSVPVSNADRMTTNGSPTIFPALRYRDAAAGLRFLTEAFGFKERSVYRGDDGTIHHAELEIGRGIIMFGEYDEQGWLGGAAPDPLRSTVSIYIAVADPDAHHHLAIAAGANIVRPLEDTDYGSREYSARDPGGNLFSFGTYNPYSTS
jgi:uncharacterized glyoxalase superfamily protein PhnB